MEVIGRTSFRDVSGSTNKKLGSIKGDSQSQSIANIIQRIEEKKDRRNSNEVNAWILNASTRTPKNQKRKKIDTAMASR